MAPINKSNCLCGYVGRIDTVNLHKKRCKGLPIITRLMHENERLRTLLSALNKDVSLQSEVPEPIVIKKKSTEGYN